MAIGCAWAPCPCRRGDLLANELCRVRLGHKPVDLIDASIQSSRLEGSAFALARQAAACARHVAMRSNIAYRRLCGPGKLSHSFK
jgi:hypothetical protein